MLSWKAQGAAQFLPEQFEEVLTAFWKLLKPVSIVLPQQSEQLERGVR